MLPAEQGGVGIALQGFQLKEKEVLEALRQLGALDGAAERRDARRDPAPGIGGKPGMAPQRRAQREQLRGLRLQRNRIADRRRAEVVERELDLPG